MLRTLIVDDEPLARQGLREFASHEPDLEVVAECGDGRAALEAIRRHHPDLVLLDVQMPEMTGFDVLAALDGPLPAVIFVTAYDTYALRAFDAHAVDYLLKPVELERFRQAVTRARAQIDHDRGGRLAAKLSGLLAEVAASSPYPRRFTVKTAGRVTFVRVADIDWIEAAGNYARLHVGIERHVVRVTMSALERQLDPQQFARIHRSTIVNVDRIREIQPWFKGDHLVILLDGTKLSLTRKYRDRLL